MHAAAKIQVKPGMTAVVVGAGVIGLLVVEVLKYRGCATVIAADKDDARLAIAAAVGADVAVNVDRTDLRATVLAATGGLGADCALEAVGLGKTIAGAIGTLKRGGHLVLIGNISPSVELPLQEIVTN